MGAKELRKPLRENQRVGELRIQGEVFGKHEVANPILCLLNGYIGKSHDIDGLCVGRRHKKK